MVKRKARAPQPPVQLPERTRTRDRRSDRPHPPEGGEDRCAAKRLRERAEAGLATRLPQLPGDMDHAGVGRRGCHGAGSAGYRTPDGRGGDEALLQAKEGGLPAGFDEGDAEYAGAVGREVVPRTCDGNSRKDDGKDMEAGPRLGHQGTHDRLAEGGGNPARRIEFTTALAHGGGIGSQGLRPRRMTISSGVMP